MITPQLVLLALMAFGAANGAAIPSGQHLEQELAIARDYSQVADFQHPDKRLIGLLDIGGTNMALARNTDPPTRAEAGMQAAGVYNPPNDNQQQHKALHSHDEHQHKASSDKKGDGDKGNKSGNSGPAAVSSAVAAAGTASPTVSNDKGVKPVKTDASSASGAKSTSSASAGKNADAKPTKAAAAAASSLASPSGTWSWKAGAFGCPDGASAKGSKHLCTATAVTSFTETDGSKGVATDASVASSSSASSASPTATTSSKAATKHSHKEESSGGCDDEDEDDDDNDTSDATSAGDKDGPRTKHNHDQPAPALANSTSSSAMPSSSSRINIPSANLSNTGRVMIPLNRKRSFEGTFEEKKQRYQMLKSMNNEINKLKKVLIKEVKTQQEQHVKTKPAAAVKSVGSFSAKTVVYQDLKAVDNQINQLKKTLTQEIDRPGVQLVDAKVNGAVSDDLKAVNEQIDSIRKVLNKGTAQKVTVDAAAKSAIVHDIKAVNAQLNDIKKVLSSKQTGPSGVVSADHAHFKQLPAATHNSVAADQAAQEQAHALDEATQPRFTVERKNLCALASIIFGLVGLVPLAILAVVRHKSRVVFCGAFASLVGGSLYTLYILENTLVYHSVLPSTFTLAYLSLLCLQSIFALLIRTPVLTMGRGYVFLRDDEEEDKERV